MYFNFSPPPVFHPDPAWNRRNQDQAYCLSPHQSHPRLPTVFPTPELHSRQAAPRDVLDLLMLVWLCLVRMATGDPLRP